MEFREASFNDLETIHQLAYKIWPVVYREMLSLSQIEYMLNLFYSLHSLQNQVNILNHRFILVYDESVPIGYASYSDLNNNLAKLHKLYLLPEVHGKGYGARLLNQVVLRVKHLTALELNVNRFNPVVQFYKKHDFKIIREEDVDIGNGYFMNDYIMRKQL